MEIVSTLKEKKEEPNFSLSSLQQGYLFGTQSAFDLHVATHTYFEFCLDELDTAQFETAFNQLIKHHDALRTIVTDDGKLNVLDSVPYYNIKTNDWSDLPEEKANDCLAATRHHHERANFDFSHWPCFEAQLSIVNKHIHVHLNFTPMFTDGVSVSRLLHQLSILYKTPDEPLNPTYFNYADYAWHREKQRQSDLFKKAKQYWWQRLDTLPGGPELPIKDNHIHAIRSSLNRRRALIPRKTWQVLEGKTLDYKLKPTAVLLTLYGAVISNWSKTNHFTITMLVQHRDKSFPGIEHAVASFASTILVELDFTKQQSFIEQVKQVQKQLFLDFMHSRICGLEFLQERNREQHSIAHAGSPVAFVSNLEAHADESWSDDLFHRNGRHLINSNLETPQVYLDHQLAETQDNELALNWDAMDAILPEGLADEMLEAYQSLINELATSTDLWSEPLTIPLPEEQRNLIKNSNLTQFNYPKQLLHEPFYGQLDPSTDELAVISTEQSLSYTQLADYSIYIEHQLRNADVRPNELVAIFMHKGWQQIPAALGITASGAAYVPIDPSLPIKRIEYLLDCCNIKHLITQPEYENREEIQRVNKIIVSNKFEIEKQGKRSFTAKQNMTDLAYVIFTSGSTGLPKGVMLNHEGPVNTILDINRKFGITTSDKVFAISALSFDLSVYDLFGALAAGGSIVIPDYDHIRDPAHWLDMLEQHQVTVWNSAPALMQMLVEYSQQTGRALPESLRVVMLSGDWIPTWLPTAIHQQRPDINIYSLGGATEASIWSIYYPINNVKPDWLSIPYGKALANQTMHVLDEAMQVRPIGVPGHIYIGGTGLAMGYWKNSEITNAAFIMHPNTGERLYRTGDLGRYLPDGNIEFLGREDSQIKLQGYRVELGEIESVLQQHPDVTHAVVVVHGDNAANKRLIAYIAIGQAQLDQEAILSYASSQLPPYMIPADIILLDQLPVTENGKIDRKNLPNPAQIQNEHHKARAPETETEIAMAEIWQDVLNLEDNISATASFFDLGGQSFLSVRMMLQVQNRFGITLPLASLIEADTIEKLSIKIDEHNQLDKQQDDTPLVLLQKGSHHSPVFLIHPVGGNVLCYRSFVTHLTSLDTDFYGLQSYSGLNDSRPSHSLVEMAERYIDAIKDIHNGPFSIGGWSMGGVIAAEMTHQLVEQNETVDHLFMFDSPAPLVNEMPGQEECLHWFFRDLLSGDTQWLTEYLATQVKVNWPDLMSYVIEKNIVMPGTSQEQLDSIYGNFIHNLKALITYQAKPVHSVENILLLRAADKPIDELSQHPAASDPSWGWQDILKAESGDALQITSTPGDHYSIFSGQNLIELTTTFSKWYRTE